MRYLSINQTQVFTHISASTFSTTSSYFPFYYEFLGSRRLRLGVFSSSAWTPLGRDIRAHRCCRDKSVRVITFANSKVKSAGTP